MKRQTHSLSFKNDPLKLQYVRIAVTGTSIRQEFQISRSSLQRILTRHMCLNAYKIQLTQQLKLNHGLFEITGICQPAHNHMFML